MKNLYEYSEYASGKSSRINEIFGFLKGDKSKNVHQGKIESAKKEIDNFDVEELFRPITDKTNEKEVSKALSEIKNLINRKLSKVREVLPHLFRSSEKGSGGAYAIKRGEKGIIPSQFTFLITPENRLISGDKGRKLFKDELDRIVKKTKN